MRVICGHEWVRFRQRRSLAARRAQSVLRGNLSQSEYLRGAQLYDQFDITLEDPDLLGEVELTTDLIVAANESDQLLSAAEIDRILGISPGLKD